MITIELDETDKNTLHELKLSENIVCDFKPLRLKDKPLMSPGTWNGHYYSPIEIQKSFLATKWENKEVRGLFLDHKDREVSSWVGMIENPRLVGNDIIGDLIILDKPTAIKLAYGAKFGISPKVGGDLRDGAMYDFVYDNFSVVVVPAIKTNYINHTETDTNTEKEELTQDKIKKIKVNTMSDKIKELSTADILDAVGNKNFSAYSTKYTELHKDAQLNDIVEAFKTAELQDEEDDKKAESKELFAMLKSLTTEISEIKTKLEEKVEPKVEEDKPVEPVVETVEDVPKTVEPEATEEVPVEPVKEEMSKEIIDKIIDVEKVTLNTVETQVQELSEDQLDAVMLKGMLVSQGDTGLAEAIKL